MFLKTIECYNGSHCQR